MITKENKVRGYKVNIPQFSTVDEIITQLGNDRLIKVVNSQLTAHQWNSQFEAAVVDDAQKVGGHKMLTEKNEKGNDVVIETNSKFLTRTGYKVTPERAQQLADGIAYPPTATERGPKTDAFQKVATDKVNSLDEAQLAKAMEKFAVENKDELILAVATKLRSDDL